MYEKYADHINLVPNSGGGFSYELDKWGTLNRFLIIGSESGTYYAGERELTVGNIKNLEACIKEDGARVVREIVQVSDGGRAAKNDPAIFALAAVTVLGDDQARATAFSALQRVCRIGTHLMHFAKYREAFSGGWGRGTRQAVGAWFNDKAPRDLAYQLIKYQSRDDWAMRDLLRLAHPKPPTSAHKGLYHYVTQGWDSIGPVPHPDNVLVVAWAAERIKLADNLSEVCQLITDYRLPREIVPTQWLNERKVWEALLPHMGLTAIMRNLATMTRIGLIAPFSQTTREVISAFEPARIHKARLHPISILQALTTYRAGRGIQSNNVWTPVSPVVNALDDAFYAAFQNVEPTGKNILVGVDVSSSMGGAIPGSFLSSRDVAAAMAMVFLSTEVNVHVVGFSHNLIDLGLNPKMRLDTVVSTMANIPFGATDCSLPMLAAMGRAGSIRRGTFYGSYGSYGRAPMPTWQGSPDIDAFVIITDNETNMNEQPPARVLKDYRRESGRPAKLVVLATTPTSFTIADPKDGGMLDVAGFDSAVPQLVGDFIR
jgi:60 kDa SS-A/Ro ribonucleoprotein